MECYISLASTKVDKMHALMINPETKTLQVVQFYNDPNFKFIFTNNLIIHKKSGKVLDALGGAIEGAQIGLWDINGCANQEWFLNDDKTIRSQNGLCMSFEKKSDYNNKNIILAKYSQNTPQWRIVSCGSSD